MNYGRQYALQTLIALSSAVATGVLFYILRIILYRDLPPEQYALFYAALAVSAIVYPALSFGFEPGIVPHITRLREQNDLIGVKSLVIGALAPQALLACILLVVACAGAKPLSALLFPWAPEAMAQSVVRLVAAYTAFVVLLKTASSLLLGLQSIASRSLAEVAYAAVCLLGSVIFIRHGAGAGGPAFAYVLAVLAGSAVAIGCVLALHPALARAPFRLDLPLVANVFRSGKYLTIAFGGAAVFSSLDTAMLSLLRNNPREVADYQIAAPTIMIFYGLLMAGMRNTMPMAALLWHRGESQLLARSASRAFDAAAVFLLPGATLAACFSDVLMAALFRRPVYEAPAAFNILAMGSAFYCTCWFSLQLLAGIGHTMGAARAVLWGIAANAALNLALIPLAGVRGAATATILSHAATTALALMAIRRELPAVMRPHVWLATSMLCIPLAFTGVAIRCSTWFLEAPILTACMAAPMLYIAAILILEALGLARLRELSANIRQQDGRI